MPKRARALATAAVFVAIVFASARSNAANVGADIAGCHAELRAAYAVKLAELADWADREQLSAEASLAREWLPAPEPVRLVLACRPAPDDAPLTAPPDANEQWQERFLRLRYAQADALFDLASKAAAAGQASIALRILPEVIRENPAHAKARTILGYEEYEGRWLTPFEILKAREGQVWHRRFGWLPTDHVARYEAGERYYRNRWIKARDEERIRSAPPVGWDIVSEHYTIHTSHSLEEGVRLARRLERLYDAWQQMFAGFSASEVQLARRFAGQAASPGVPVRHKVVYFRDRDEYVRALEKDEPNIGVSTGYYLAAKRTAYFYAGDAEDDSNLYHEATHQLFNEVRHSVRNFGADANFWVVEGIACYMESLAETRGWHLLGGENAVRLRDAVHRLAVDNYYVPLAELTSYGMQRLKRDPNIAMLYSQSSGLTYFLIHGNAGRYRGPLVEYLAAIYQGRDRPDTLAALCGASNADLDEQYRHFIKSLELATEGTENTEKKN